MTRQSFHDEMDALQRDILQMGTYVEEAIFKAVKALAQGDTELGRTVIEEDDRIDQLQLDIEKKCLELLALQQPMASDLRVIGTSLKIITDLERMADHASGIAKTALRLEGQPLIKPLVDIPRMAEIAQRMVREALNAFVDRDVERALAMINLDDEIDHLYSQVFRELLLIMMENPQTINQATSLLFVGSHLERIADHATNLGEWVIYIVTGERKELNN